MAKILSYFHLCPINDEEEFLGLSQDAASGTVINTLGKNIIINVKLSNQKQMNSWTVLEKLSSKVVYDFNTKKYVGVFAHKWIRCWPETCSDINKIKKIKLSKPVKNLISFENRNTIVLYLDGTCESLECAIESRKEKKDLSLPQFKSTVDNATTEILNTAHFRTANDSILFTYFTKSRQNDEIHLIYYKLDSETLRLDGPINKLKLMREENVANLCGFTVVDGNSGPQLVSIWSDRRIFMMPLRITEDAPGHFVAMLTAIKVDQPLSVQGISRDCIAIYGANASLQEGATLILYNTQFKVIESKQMFKVYFSNSRLWIVDTYIFLAVGQKLAAVSFRISKEQLSDMLGSQRAMNLTSSVDTECINIDGTLEEALEFDEVVQMHTNSQRNENSSNGNGLPDYEKFDKESSGLKQAYENPQSVYADLRALQQHDIIVDINRDDNLLADMLLLKLSSNVNDNCFENETIRLLVGELERMGASEIEITNCIIPAIIDSDLFNELVTCARTYTNISEKMLVTSIKYFLDKILASQNDSEYNKLWKTQLNVILSCSFDPELIIEQLRIQLSFDDVLLLLNHIVSALESNDKQLEERPQNGNFADEDLLLAKWFSAIIDSHFHQFILSHDRQLIEMLSKWKDLVDNLLFNLEQTKSVAALLYNLMDGKLVTRENVASKWYSVEEVKLY